MKRQWSARRCFIPDLFRISKAKLTQTFTTTRFSYGKNCAAVSTHQMQNGHLWRGTMLSGDKEILQIISDSSIYTLIAMAGGLVKWLMDGTWKLPALLTSMAGGGFSGLMVYMALYDADISPATMSFVTGVAGSSGGAVLLHAQNILIDYLKKIFGTKGKVNSDEQNIS